MMGQEIFLDRFTLWCVHTAMSILPTPRHPRRAPAATPLCLDGHNVVVVVSPMAEHDSVCRIGTVCEGELSQPRCRLGAQPT